MRSPVTRQRQGELAVAQPKGSRPPPPFERWSFRKRRYVQYLRDQLEVHAVMESAISAAVGDEEVSAEDAGARAGTPVRVLTAEVTIGCPTR